LGAQGSGADVAPLMGRAAVANAKLAYASFERRLASDRWRTLAEAGAKPQRMLWASTSTKNAAYPDIKYVEPLIGELTINTMPEKTIAAFLDHGTAADTIRDGIDEAGATMAALAGTGLDFAAVTDQLLEEGLAKFVTPFDRLLESLEARATALVAN